MTGFYTLREKSPSDLTIDKPPILEHISVGNAVEISLENGDTRPGFVNMTHYDLGATLGNQYLKIKMWLELPEDGLVEHRIIVDFDNDEDRWEDPILEQRSDKEVIECGPIDSIEVIGEHFGEFEVVDSNDE